MPNVPSEGERLRALLKNAGEFASCRGCGAQVRWIRHTNGKAAPYDHEDADTAGTNHFATCLNRKDFRRK